MKLYSAIRPISEVKAQAAEIIRAFHEDAAPPVIITQNGEATAVLMSIHEYERMQETMAMLKGLSLSNKSIDKGKGVLAKNALAKVRKRTKARDSNG